MSAISPTTSMSTPTSSLDLPMRRFVWRRRRLRAAGAACVGGALVLAWLLAGGLVDRVARLGSAPRLAMLVALLLILAGSFMRVVMLLIDRRFNRQIAARQIESMDGDLAERLMTVITQAELPAAQRGSAGLTAVLADEVTLHLHRAPPDQRLTWRFVRPAVVLLTLLVLIAIGLYFVPSLGLPRLIARQLFPLADLPPVTTTRIDVVTGSVDLPQGQALAVVADIAGSEGPVTLLIGSDDNQLQPIAAARVFGGRYSATVKSIDSDQIYRVQAGDATSKAFHVRVMRRPGVVRLGLTMIFPDYFKRGPIEIARSDGKIEAVRGTRVHATIVGTESLRQATAALPEGVLPAETTVDPAVRTFDFTVGNSGPWSISLVSERGVTGNGPGGMTINSIEDKPPAAKLLKSDLRLAPTDVAAVPFEATDDFGLASLRLDVLNGGKTLQSIPIKVSGDTHAARDVATVDLAPLAMTFGDVVTLALTATDIAGQSTTSSPCQVLISPRSMDLRALRRIETLTAARELAETTVNSPDDSTALTRALLRAISATDSPAANDFLEKQLDTAQQAASTTVWKNQPQWTPQQADALRDMAKRLTTVERGEQAKGVLADMENVAAAEKALGTQTSAEKYAAKQSVARAKRDINNRIASLGLSPDAADTLDRLQQLAAAGDETIKSTPPASRTEAADLWANSKGASADVQRDSIAIAAQSQVLRPDADLAWARDLQQIARAMTALDQKADGKDRGKIREATAALENQHKISKAAATPPDVARRAAEARKTLARLAEESQAPAATQPSMLEDAVANAAALEQEHDESDNDNNDGPEKWQPPADASKAHPNDTPAERQARSLNDAARRQKRVGERTEKAAPEAAKSLAEQQQSVADQLQQIESQRDEDFFQQPKLSQEDALATLRQMQRDLTDLPQQMISAKQSAESASKIKGQQSDESAQHAADSAARQQADAMGKMFNASAGGAAKLGATGQHVSAAASKLAGELSKLKGDLNNGDQQAGDRDQATALESVAALQATLRTAQRQVIDRDPVVAAKFFAQQAASALRREPPDLVAARSDQQAASASLEQAWDQAMARAVKGRLSSLPSFRALLDDDTFTLGGGGLNATPLPRSATAEWGRLRSQKTADVVGGDAEFQPQGFEQPLSAYFDALSRARSKGAGQ